MDDVVKKTRVKRSKRRDDEIASWAYATGYNEGVKGLMKILSDTSEVLRKKGFKKDAKKLCHVVEEFSFVVDMMQRKVPCEPVSPPKINRVWT